MVRVAGNDDAPQRVLHAVRHLGGGGVQDDLQRLLGGGGAGGAGAGAQGSCRRAGAVGGLGVRAGREGLRVVAVRHDGGELLDQVLLELATLGGVAQEGGEVGSELVAGLLDALVGSGGTAGGVEHGSVLLGTVWKRDIKLLFSCPHNVSREATLCNTAYDRSRIKYCTVSIPIIADG